MNLIPKIGALAPQALADQRRRYHERLSDHFPARMACGSQRLDPRDFSR